MLVYIILFLVFAFIFWTEEKMSIQQLQNFAIFSFSAVVLTAGLRDMIGGYDIYVYSEVYESDGRFILTFKPFEFGFRLYYLLLRIFSTDRYFMLFVSSLLTFLLFSYNIKRYAYLPFFAAFIIFCKFYLMSYVYVRQGIAMGVIWLAIPFIIKRSYFVVALLCITAFFIHKSSIVFLPLVLLGNYRFNPFTIAVCAALAIFISLTPLSNLFLNLFSENIGDAKVSKYVAKSGAINIFYLIESLIIFGVLFFFGKNLYRYKQSVIFFNGALFYVFLILISLTNASFIRFSWYYLIFVAIGISFIYYFLENKNKLLFKSITFLYFTLLFFRLMISFDNGDFIPYKSVLFDTERTSIWDKLEYRIK